MDILSKESAIEEMEEIDKEIFLAVQMIQIQR